MLKVNLRHLEEHGIRLQGELPVAELDLGVNDELVRTEKPLCYDLTIEQFKDGDQGPLIGVPVDIRYRHGAFQPMDGENGKAIFRELHRLGHGPLLMRIAPRLGDHPYWSYSVCMPEPGKPAPVTPV